MPFIHAYSVLTVIFNIGSKNNINLVPNEYVLFYIIMIRFLILKKYSVTNGIGAIAWFLCWVQLRGNWRRPKHSDSQPPILDQECIILSLFKMYGKWRLTVTIVFTKMFMGCLQSNYLTPIVIARQNVVFLLNSWYIFQTSAESR